MRSLQGNAIDEITLMPSRRFNYFIRKLTYKTR